MPLAVADHHPALHRFAGEDASWSPLRGERQCQGHRGSPPHNACDLYVAAMGFDQLLHDRQLQPTASGRSRAGSVRSVEALEDKRQIVRCDADTGVLDCDFYSGARGRRLPGRGTDTGESSPVSLSRRREGDAPRMMPYNDTVNPSANSLSRNGKSS